MKILSSQLTAPTRECKGQITEGLVTGDKDRGSYSVPNGLTLKGCEVCEDGLHLKYGSIFKPVCL